jgi:hypothetical protein
MESPRSPPVRGKAPPEIEGLDLAARELHEPSCRIIYEVIDKELFVYRVLDGRRNVHDNPAGEPPGSF